MEIFNLNYLKDSITESYKFNKQVFKNKLNNAKVINLAFPKLFYNIEVVAQNLKEYKEIKLYLLENIGNSFIVPIFSSLSSNFTKNELILDYKDFNIKPFFDINDFVLFTNTNFNEFYELRYIEDYINNKIILNEEIELLSNTKICLGKELVLDKDISINDISNTYKTFNITLYEL